MAEKRMFSIKIIDSDAFLDMPLSAQALYFHLSMRADDEGFINNANKIQRMINASNDDLKLLVAKRFILVFESGVIVVKHWFMHNTIRKERLKETGYTEERNMLYIKSNGSYTFEKFESFVADEKVEQLCLIDEEEKPKQDKPLKENEYQLDLSVILEKLYSFYPKKSSKAKGLQNLQAYLLKGKEHTALGRIKLNHLQIDLAIKQYAIDSEGTEQKYLKEFSTFTNLAIVDYVEKTKPLYEKYMLKTYGENWRKVKFLYK